MYQRIPFIDIVAFKGQACHEGSFVLFLITLAQDIFIQGFDLIDQVMFLLPAATLLSVTQTSSILLHTGCGLCAKMDLHSAIHTLERKERPINFVARTVARKYTLSQSQMI